MVLPSYKQFYFQVRTSISRCEKKNCTSDWTDKTARANPNVLVLVKTSIAERSFEMMRKLMA